MLVATQVRSEMEQFDSPHVPERNAQAQNRRSAWVKPASGPMRARRTATARAGARSCGGGCPRHQRRGLRLREGDAIIASQPTRPRGGDECFRLSSVRARAALAGTFLLLAESGMVCGCLCVPDERIVRGQLC